MCVPLSKICDGRVNCPFFDDELTCNFTCPDECSCSGFVIDCSQTDITSSIMAHIPTQTRYLDLSQNIQIGETNFGLDRIYKYLYHLNVSFCNLRGFLFNPFENASSLLFLDLSFNDIQVLERHIFRNLFKLKEIHLQGNKNLRQLDPFAFVDLTNVNELLISGIKVYVLQKDTFSGLTLKHLHIIDSTFNSVENEAFRNLQVDEIDLSSNDIEDFSSGI